MVPRRAISARAEPVVGIAAQLSMLPDQDVTCPVARLDILTKHPELRTPQGLGFGHASPQPLAIEIKSELLRVTRMHISQRRDK